MGYFSNGIEGERYEAEFCERCVHYGDPATDGGCPVWLAHMLHNYDECNNPGSILHLLIPRAKIGNERCRMFIPDDTASLVSERAREKAEDAAQKENG